MGAEGLEFESPRPDQSFLAQHPGEHSAIGRSDFHPSWPRRSEHREDRDPAAIQIRKSISIHAPEQSYLDGRRFATLARRRGHDGYKGSRNAIRPFALRASLRAIANTEIVGQTVWMTVDTLSDVKRLESAGVPRLQAEAHAEAMRAEIAPQVATKSDVDTALALLGKDVEAVRNHMSERFALLQWMLATNIALSLGILWKPFK